MDKVVQISCRGAEADSHGPTVCRTKEIPLLLNTVIDVPVAQVVHLFSGWSSLQFIDRVVDLAVMLRQIRVEILWVQFLDKFDVPVVSRQVVVITVVAQRLFPMVQWADHEIRLQSIDKVVDVLVVQVFGCRP